MEYQPRCATHDSRLIYNDYKTRAEHERDYTDPINIESGVKQGCVKSPTLLLIIINWIMKKVTDNRTEITWKLQTNWKISSLSTMCVY
jgi:hypothetical protein